MKLINSINKRTVAGLLAIMIAISACGESEEQDFASPKTASVEVATIQASNAVSTNQLSGTIKSETRSEIGTKVIGEVESTPFRIGDRVRKGSIVLRIKDDDLIAKKAQIEAGLNEVQARMALVEKDYQRYESLYKSGSATQREWDEVQANYSAVKAKLASTESQLEEIEDLLSYTQIKAPYNGVIAALYVDEGDIASPGRPLIALEKENEFEIEAAVPESSIQHINVKDTLRVQIPSIGGEMLQAVVSELSASGDPMSRQFKVKLKLLESDESQGLKSGMYVEIGLSRSAGNTLFVPRSALVERGQLKGLYVVTANKEAVLRWITSGTESKDKVEILSGINAGEQFVLNSTKVEYDGQPVSFVN